MIICDNIQYYCINERFDSFYSGIDENISFEAPWGEEMRIAAGGVLILNGAQDIYGIQAEEFASTYRVLPPQTDTLQKVLALLQQT